MTSTPPIVEIPHVEAAIDPDSVTMEEMRNARAQSPRATIGEAGTFWDPSRKMSVEMMTENASALIGSDAVYMMRREGESKWVWYCGLLSREILGGIRKVKVTLSRKTSLLQGVYQHIGADETFDFPHVGFEYAHVISKDVYWNMWAQRVESENISKFDMMNRKVEEMELRLATTLSQTQVPQPQIVTQQHIPQVGDTLQSVLTLPAQNQQMCQVQIQQRDDMLRKKTGGEVCPFTPENIESNWLQTQQTCCNGGRYWHEAMPIG